MVIKLDAQQVKNFEVSSRREWLLTNGIGGYSMGTASGANSRRYHGHLVAATKPPTHRMVLLANIEAFVQADGSPIGLSCNQYQGALFPEGYLHTEGFSVGRQADWFFKAGGLELRKSIVMHEGENAISIRYTNTGSKALGLTLRPLVCHKFYHHNFRVLEDYPHKVDFPTGGTLVEHDGVTLFLSHEGAQRVPAMGWYYRFEYMRDMERGLDPRDDLYCPCELRYELSPGESAILIAADFEHSIPKEFDQEEPPMGASLGDALRSAADRYFVQGEGRTSIIAGYPWFTDWGRDTMIALPGLCLHTGRVATARQILLDYMKAMKQGLIPNRFVEEGQDPEYNTVDATLWMANAVYATLQAEWNEPFAVLAWQALKSMFEWHVKGTLYGIKVDPLDGLLHQGEIGVQLTWMDAKVGDWVVTPRHGKPIEIQGLWINALRVLEWLGNKLSQDTKPITQAAEIAEANFEAKFWRENLGHYLDTADPDDASLRPNQLIAMSLPFGPATGPNAVKALNRISTDLLTEYGLRTLGPDEPGYKPRYRGSLSELDAAYHQGTVWPWLFGPYITALVKLTGDRAEAKRILRGTREMLTEYGLLGLAEVFDGEKPRAAAGCPFQAWSVAEVLRAWVEDAHGT